MTDKALTPFELRGFYVLLVVALLSIQFAGLLVGALFLIVALLYVIGATLDKIRISLRDQAGEDCRTAREAMLRAAAALTREQKP